MAPHTVSLVNFGDVDRKTILEPILALTPMDDGGGVGDPGDPEVKVTCKYDCPNGGTLGTLPGSNPPLTQCIFTGCTLIANQPAKCPATIDPLYEAPVNGTCPTGDSTQTIINFFS